MVKGIVFQGMQWRKLKNQSTENVSFWETIKFWGKFLNVLSYACPICGEVSLKMAESDRKKIKE